MNKNTTLTKKEKNGKQTKIILVRRFGDRDFVQLYSKYVAEKILSRAEKKSA